MMYTVSNDYPLFCDFLIFLSCMFYDHDSPGILGLKQLACGLDRQDPKMAATSMTTTSLLCAI